jgi:recombinational DNA repair protein (RecF pathway)
MSQTAVESCCRCGRTIQIKDVKSYHVTEDYRLMCEPCFRIERSGEPAVEHGETEQDKSQGKKR